jgi:hypothetical protein
MRWLAQELDFDNAPAVAQQFGVGLDNGEHAAMSVAFRAAMPRCLSRSTGLSFMR